MSAALIEEIWLSAQAEADSCPEVEGSSIIVSEAAGLQ